MIVHTGPAWSSVDLYSGIQQTSRQMWAEWYPDDSAKSTSCQENRCPECGAVGGAIASHICPPSMIDVQRLAFIIGNPECQEENYYGNSE